VDVFVIDAQEPANAIAEFIRLTGAPVMCPATSQINSK
jgi:alpha-glucosidase (family GH31 glycosyl hydrolase)